MISIRRLLAALAATSVACISPAVAQPAGGRPIQLVVPFAADGAADLVARTFAEGLMAVSPSGVVVFNRPGEGGALGKSLVANARPDGLTLGIVSGNESNTNLARGLTAICLLVRGNGERIPAGYWQALVGPPGMDPQLVRRINRDASAALENVRDRLTAFGLAIVASSESDFAAFVLAGGGPLPQSPNVSGAGEQQVLIGYAGPLSGSLRHLGKDNENGVAFAIARANASSPTIGGRRIRFVLRSEDDQANPAVAARAAQALVDAGVAAVIGHLSSGASLPASTIYDRAGIPMISGSATNPSLTERGLRTVFRTIGRDDQQGAAIGEYIARALKPARIVILDDRTAYGQSIAIEVVKGLGRNGLRPAAHEFVTDTQRDFSAVLAKIRPRRPDVIFYGGMDDTGAPLVKQAREMGIEATFFFGDGACTPQMGAPAEGMLCSQVGMPREAVSWAFSEGFRAQYGEIVQYAPYYYDATLAVIEAMKKADSTDPARFARELFNVSFEGTTGKVEFDAKGDRREAPVTFYKLKAGKLVPVARSDRLAAALEAASPGQGSACDVPRGRFVGNGDVVTDTQTGLTWQRCSVGQAWSAGKGCQGRAMEFAWTELDKAVVRGWRVPTQEELVRIQASGCVPAIDQEAFPNTPSGLYWSTSIYPDKNPGFANFGKFGGGGSGPANVGMYVRLVRDR